MSTAKIIELVGTSPNSWQEAAQNALASAAQTLNDISGLEVTNMTASVENGTVTMYKSTVKVAFRVHQGR